MTEQKKWTKFRHKIVTFLLYYPFALAARIQYGYKTKALKDGRKRQYMIIMNHQSPFDQFFIALTFKKPVYYVASADLFSRGIISRCLEYLVAPIPIKKSTQDLFAIRTMMQVLREGGSIAIFPEGNRTFSGSTTSIKPGIAKLIKKLGLPIVIMRIEGGFAASPRWSPKRRHIQNGRTKTYIYKILEPEEYNALSNDEFFKIISESLEFDEAKSGLIIKSKRRAENIEEVLYYCPDCGLSHFESRNEKFWCVICGRKWVYNEDLSISNDSPSDKPCLSLNDWYIAQNNFISSLNSSEFIDKEICCETVNLFQVRLYHSKKCIAKNISFVLMGNKYIFKKGDEVIYELNFDDLEAVTVQGGNKLIIYCKKEILQVIAAASFNAIKYMNFYYHYINQKNNQITTQGDQNEFLGL